MKNFFKYILQKTLGLELYLYLFARFVICKLPYSKHEKDFLKFIDLIEDGAHVLDIGANIGVMTYYLSKRLPNSAIHSFEPLPENLNTLLRVKGKLRLFNVKAYGIALGDKPGTIEMVMPQKNKVFFHGLSHVKSNEEQQGKIHKVELKCLDEIKEFSNIKINAIKIDVEEYEYNVLKGAESLIRKNQPIVYCELWDSENRKKSMKFMEEMGYQVFIYKGDKLVKFGGQAGFQDFFFMPEGYPGL